MNTINMAQESTRFDESDGNNYEMEALQRAAEERKEIVSRYLEGEKSGRDEDRWEDSAFSLYKIMDRYGFLHEKELPEIPSLDEDRRKQAEVKRQSKWVKMINKWKRNKNVDPEKLRSRVFKGIPLNLRGDAWRFILKVESFMNDNQKIYDEMKERSLKHSPDIKQIDMDVNRTYRNHIMFRSRYSIKQQQLFFVLAAYSMYNTEVGYCQGMSQIAALLLIYMSEEEAFWALHSLLYGERHRMHGFFIPGFPKLIRFQDHHDKILKKFVPRLKKHLDKNEIFASLYTMKWFFQCFLDRAPFPLTLRLWDIYILEGERVLVAMSYTTLKMHKTNMKKMDMDEIVTFLQENLANSFGLDDDLVIDQLKASMAELKRAKMDLPPAASESESAKLPFGAPVKPTFAQETGIRVSTDHIRNSIQLSEQEAKNTSKMFNQNATMKSNGSLREHLTNLDIPDLATQKRIDHNRLSSAEFAKTNRPVENLNVEPENLKKGDKDRHAPLTDKNQEPKSSSDVSRSEVTSIVKNSPTKEKNVFKQLKRESTTETDVHYTSPLQDGRTRIKLEWKEPTTSTLHANNYHNDSVPRSRKLQVDRNKRKERKRLKSSNEIQPETDKTDVTYSTSQVNSELLSTSGESTQVNVGKNRPFSLYDNMTSGTSENQSDIVVSVQNSTPHTTSTITSESVYQTQMEESLENLFELVASLPLSPRSNYDGRSTTSTSDSGRSRRPKSYNFIDGDLADESTLSSLDEVARNLSRSSEILEQQQRQASRPSAFRKAVEGAGIMQLPKRPSSTALNAVLAPNTFSDFSITQHNYSVNVSNSGNTQTPNDVWVPVPQQTASYNVINWNKSNFSYPTTDIFRNKGDIESYPVSVRMGLSSGPRNKNNNSHLNINHPPVLNDVSHDLLQLDDITKYDTSQGTNYDYIDSHVTHPPNDYISSNLESNTHYSTFYDQHSSSKIKSTFSNNTRFYPNMHVTTRRSDEAISRKDSNAYKSSVEQKSDIRPHGPEAIPPSYSTTASRLHYLASNNPTVHRPRRKNNANIAVQTDLPSHFDHISLV